MYKTDYTLLSNQLRAISDGVTNTTTILSNASALLNEHLLQINWVGFYILEDNQLLLGPFQGKVACTHIAIGKGVCGTSFQQNKTLVVDDVHEFPGHIACDSDSESEIVIPLHINNQPFGVLDIDAPIKQRFKEEDKVGLILFANTLQSILEN